MRAFAARERLGDGFRIEAAAQRRNWLYPREGAPYPRCCALGTRRRHPVLDAASLEPGSGQRQERRARGEPGSESCTPRGTWRSPWLMPPSISASSTRRSRASPGPSTVRDAPGATSLAARIGRADQRHLRVRAGPAGPCRCHADHPRRAEGRQRRTVRGRHVDPRASPPETPRRRRRRDPGRWAVDHGRAAGLAPGCPSSGAAGDRTPAPIGDR